MRKQTIGQQRLVQSAHLAGFGEDDRFQRWASFSPLTAESAARMGEEELSRLGFR
jgi:hypothetical protein